MHVTALPQLVMHANTLARTQSEDARLHPVAVVDMVLSLLQASIPNDDPVEEKYMEVFLESYAIQVTSEVNRKLEDEKEFYPPRAMPPDGSVVQHLLDLSEQCISNMHLLPDCAGRRQKLHTALTTYSSRLRGITASDGG